MSGKESRKISLAERNQRRDEALNRVTSIRPDGTVYHHQPLSHRDANGVQIEVGHVVRWGDREGRVLIVEGPIPGSRSTREGIGTVYVEGVGQWGDCRALEANQVEVVPQVAIGRNDEERSRLWRR